MCGFGYVAGPPHRAVRSGDRLPEGSVVRTKIAFFSGRSIRWQRFHPRRGPDGRVDLADSPFLRIFAAAACQGTDMMFRQKAHRLFSCGWKLDTFTDGKEQRLVLALFHGVGISGILLSRSSNTSLADGKLSTFFLRLFDRDRRPAVRARILAPEFSVSL